MSIQTKTIAQPSDYARAVAELVEQMPAEQAAQVYDFARFLRSQPAQASQDEAGDDDWLNASEEQMQAEDALWDAALTRHSDRFAALVEATRAEIAANTTQPMFDENGEIIADELPNHP